MATKKRIVINSIKNSHVDSGWINERIGGHGGGYFYYKPDGLARIYGIGSTPKRVIWFYNLQLFMKYCKRKLWRMYLKCMGVDYYIGGGK